MSAEGSWRETTSSSTASEKSSPPMLPPPTCNRGTWLPSGVNYPADTKLPMTNPSHKPKEQPPPKLIRIILPREVCTDPETAAKIMYGELQKALKTLRGGSDSTPDSPRAGEE